MLRLLSTTQLKPIFRDIGRCICRVSPSKETAVTLPIMLVSYDLFRMVLRENGASPADVQAGTRPWWRLVLAYIPYAALLLIYLELRRTAFTSYLLEDQWGSHAQEAASSATGFWLHLRHLAMHLTEIQIFNVRHLMLPFPAAVTFLVLGLYLAWIVALLRRRTECRRSIEVILYFGVVWYTITNLPLLATYDDPHHLYLPAIGPCIATAFLVAPACTELRKHLGYLRLLGAALLVGCCAFQLRREDLQWARKAEVTERGTAQLAAVLGNMSRPSLVVVWFPSSPTDSWDENLPYSLQQPFQPADLYSRAHIIEDPDIYCCPLDHWWAKTKPLLDAELAGAPDGTVAIHLFAWDKRSTSFRTKTRVVPREFLRTSISELLGVPYVTAETVGDDQAKNLVRVLARLASEGQ